MSFRIMFATLCLLITVNSAIAQSQYKPIFNGKDLTGWKAFVDPKAKDVPKNQWHVKEGLLIGDAGPKGFLATEKEYTDFIVRFQWKWGEKTLRKNRYSSMFVRVSGPDKIWPKGADVTLSAGNAGQFWLVDGFQLKVDPKRVDPKRDIHFFAIKTDADKPIGEWNQCTILCQEGLIRARINGHLVNEGTAANPRKGKLALLSEGAEIHFRKIEIRELK